MLFITRFEDIFKSITRIEAERKGSSNLDRVLIDLKVVIVQEMNHLINNSSLQVDSFKSVWINRVTTVMKELKLADTNKKIKKKTWEDIFSDKSASTTNETLSSGIDSKSSSTTNKKSTLSLSYQAKLTIEDPLVLEEIHSRINTKWVLKSGVCVENIIHKKNINFNYEHPLHSYIISTSDETWKTAFKPEEVKEIMEASSYSNFNNPLPNEIIDVLCKLDKKETFNEIYQVFKNVKADRYGERALYWFKESILSYIDLFYDESNIVMNSKQDLLDDVCGFIKRSKTLSGTKIEKTSCSKASSEAKNGSRTLGTDQPLTRQETGDYADLTFKTMSTEVACIEIGLEDLGPNGTKELQEKL